MIPGSLAISCNGTCTAIWTDGGKSVLDCKLIKINRDAAPLDLTADGSHNKASFALEPERDSKTVQINPGRSKFYMFFESKRAKQVCGYVSIWNLPVFVGDTRRSCMADA